MQSDAASESTEGNGSTTADTADPVLACEIHSGSIFCAECDDVVYDERFEKVLNEERRSIKGTASRTDDRKETGEIDNKEATEGKSASSFSPSTNCRICRLVF